MTIPVDFIGTTLNWDEYLNYLKADLPFMD